MYIGFFRVSWYFGALVKTIKKKYIENNILFNFFLKKNHLYIFKILITQILIYFLLYLCFLIGVTGTLVSMFIFLINCPILKVRDSCNLEFDCEINKI
jgi:hypothetical protein